MLNAGIVVFSLLALMMIDAVFAVVLLGLAIGSKKTGRMFAQINERLDALEQLQSRN